MEVEDVEVNKIGSTTFFTKKEKELIVFNVTKVSIANSNDYGILSIKLIKRVFENSFFRRVTRISLRNNGVMR